MHLKRLLWQIYPSYLAITLFSLGAVIWYASSALRESYLDRTEADLEARALLVEGQIAEKLTAADFAAVDGLCKKLGRQTATRITVILPDGKVVGESERSAQGMEDHAGRPEVQGALAGSTSRALHYSRTLQEPRMYVAVPMRREGRIVAVLRTSISMTAFDRMLRGVQVRIALGGLLVAVLVAAASLIVSRRISRPLEQLQRGAERFAHGDLGHRLSVPDSQEFAALAQTLNQMAVELDDKIRAVLVQRNEREAILSSMAEGVLALDSRERVIRINQAAARLIGIEPTRAEGRTLQEVVRNADLHRLVADVLASGEAKEGELVLRDNGERVLHVQGTVLRGAWDGREKTGTGSERGTGFPAITASSEMPVPVFSNGALVVFHEVTELKKLERVRRDFVANVSHELRTPVTSIKGFVETLLDGAMHNPEELDRFLRIVAAQTDRLNAIIEDLLTLSRIEQESERAEITLAPGSVRSVLETALEVCRLKASQQDIPIELICDAELQAPINAPLLEQAVINLVDNAIKYSPAGKPVRVDAVRTEREVVIRVRDHGCGISREHLGRIFERFYRVDKARSRKLGGTGLGLAIVKHIAQAHGGRATVESIVGQGSTFSIHLPLVR